MFFRQHRAALSREKFDIFGILFLPIRLINFQRKTSPNPAVTGCPVVILQRASAAAACPPWLDSQRHIRKRFQQSLRRWRVGHLLLVLQV
jgi:hypothetical protein